MKSYVKPELFYESFEMNQSIAACGWDMNQANSDVCNATWDPTLENKNNSVGVYLFTADTTGAVCTVTPDTRQDYCYTTGSDSYRAFQS